MITNDPSQQATPLSNQQAGFSELVSPDTGQQLRPNLGAQSLPPWLEVFKAFLFWLISVYLLAAIPAVFGMPRLIELWSKFGPPTQQALLADKPFIFWSIVGILPTHLITLALVWLFVTEGGRLPFWQTLEFKWPKYSSPTVLTLLCLLLSLVLLAIGWALTTLLGGGKTQLDLMVESSMGARIVTALVAVITAPLVEELVYRGMLYSALERAAGKATSVVMVSMLFAGVHFLQYENNIGVILVITILSFVLTLARAYTGSLVPPFIIHLVFNGIQGILIILTPYIEKLQKTQEVTPTAPGFELPVQLIQSLVVHVCRMT